MTHADKPKIIAEHQRKALIDQVHARIEADMREAQKKNFRLRKRANVFEKVGTNKINTLGETVLLTVFNPNTVEAVLLAACVLINLAGIMIDSKR
jgi:hypothetical protein